MFSQFFGQFLVDNNKISPQQFNSAIDYIKTHHVKLGLIAETEGLLTKEQAENLNKLQMQSDKRFGDLAIEQGYLTDADVSFLLGKQGNPYLIFLQALTESNILTQEEVAKSLEELKEKYQLSDSKLNSIKDGDIETILDMYLPQECKKYSTLTALVLRNIIRFVSSYIKIEDAHLENSISGKYVAYQKTIGAYDGLLGFISDDNCFLAIAQGFCKEEFPEVDEDVLDAICEFINCINGLHAADLSYSGTLIDMEPPEFGFDSDISDQDKLFVLPISIENNNFQLVIKQ